MKKKFILLLVISLLSVMVKAQIVIPLTVEGANIFGLDAKINGAPLHFILDTGASYVSISEKEKMALYLSGAINPKDFGGYVAITTANGDKMKCAKFIIREFEIGTIVLRNIDAVVIPSQTAPLLLGQSVLSRFSQYSIVGDELILYEKNIRDDVEYNKQIVRAGYYLQNGEYEKSVAIFEGLYRTGNLNDLGVVAYASALTQVGKSKDGLLLFYKIFSKPGVDIQEIGIDALTCYIIAAYTADNEGKYIINALSLARKAEKMPLTNNERYYLYSALAISFSGGKGGLEKSFDYAIKAVELSKKDDVNVDKGSIGALYYLISEYYRSTKDFSKADAYRILSEYYGFEPED